MEIAFKCSETFEFDGEMEVNVLFFYSCFTRFGKKWLGFDVHKWHYDTLPRWNVKCGFFSFVIGIEHKWIPYNEFIKSKAKITCACLSVLAR